MGLEVKHELTLELIFSSRLARAAHIQRTAILPSMPWLIVPGSKVKTSLREVTGIGRTTVIVRSLLIFTWSIRSAVLTCCVVFISYLLFISKRCNRKYIRVESSLRLSQVRRWRWGMEPGSRDIMPVSPVGWLLLSGCLKKTPACRILQRSSSNGDAEQTTLRLSQVIFLILLAPRLISIPLYISVHIQSLRSSLPLLTDFMFVVSFNVHLHLSVISSSVSTFIPLPVRKWWGKSPGLKVDQWTGCSMTYRTGFTWWNSTVLSTPLWIHKNRGYTHTHLSLLYQLRLLFCCVW